MATKIGRGDYVPDIYLSAKLHCFLIKGFCPPHMRSYVPNVHSASFYFLGSSNSLLPRPMRRFWRSIVKWRCFAQGCAFWGPENKFLHFDPVSPKMQIFGRFSTGLRKFRLKTGFNMGGFISKYPLNDQLRLTNWMMISKSTPEIKIWGQFLPRK